MSIDIAAYIDINVSLLHAAIISHLTSHDYILLDTFYKAGFKMVCDFSQLLCMNFSNNFVKWNISEASN